MTRDLQNDALIGRCKLSRLQGLEKHARNGACSSAGDNGQSGRLHRVFTTRTEV